MNWFGPKYSELSDEQLMQRIGRSDDRAFSELYQRYQKALFRYFHRMLWKDREKAEDFVQDFFMKIIRKPESFDASRKFSTWMYSIAHNMCKNEYRSMEIRKPSDFETETYYLVGTPGDQIEKQIDRKKFMVQLVQELEELDENQRSTFLLRYEENLSIREISEVLSCSEGTVKSRLFYTLRRLASRLTVFAPESQKVSS